MLSIYGNSSGRFCDGLSRRNFLKIGGLGMGGLALPEMLKASANSGGGKREKSIIMIYLPGGPPHQDMYDLKMDARDSRESADPDQRAGRSDFRDVAENARQMHRSTAIRSWWGAQHSNHIAHRSSAWGAEATRRLANLWCGHSKMQGEKPAMPPFVGLENKMKHRPHTAATPLWWRGANHFGRRAMGRPT